MSTASRKKTKSEIVHGLAYQPPPPPPPPPDPEEPPPPEKLEDDELTGAGIVEPMVSSIKKPLDGLD